MKFQAGQVVEHKNGGRYAILHTPDYCNLYHCITTKIKKDAVPAYAYVTWPIQTETPFDIWIRPQSEMEDGRFTLVA